MLSLEEKKKAQAFLAAGEGTLRTFEPKKPPGFARLPEKSEERKYLEALTSQEKLSLLRQTLEAKPDPQQKFLLLKLSLLQKLATHLASKNPLEMSDLLGGGQELLLAELLQEPKAWFEENITALIPRILTDEHFDLDAALPPEVKEILERYNSTL